MSMRNNDNLKRINNEKKTKEQCLPHEKFTGLKNN